MESYLAVASAFMATNARLLDRRRFDLKLDRCRPEDVLSALAAYRNADGGYGWGLEPDLRARGSQPGAALHAFEVLEEVGPAGADDARRLFDWLGSITLADGGLPFALPIPEDEVVGTAPWWLGADPLESSLHATAMLAATAHSMARHDEELRRHLWLVGASDYCLRKIVELDAPRHAIEFVFVLRFLDAVHELLPGAAAELARLGRFLPAAGVLPVEGGAEGEATRPLDFSPHPVGPLRDLFAPEVIAAELARLASEQQSDGGWIVDWISQSPAGALDWRGWATVRAVAILRANHGTR
ncbi:hypothetical protein [Actinomadura sp. HBU206391]|uniref:hypothetical protein n=1 Tax=Actinomadura sp. HBU206391 TaxID=2731692 RepID=UPI00164F06CA|nr:hypothetical protein [Actinomadura sp. HBU206391]MBC6458827.1 hypothetical protein [Actinomadura sp. HBU206391]